MRQKQALRVMMDGDSVFLTGAPGAGKTYVLNQFVSRARNAGKRVAVTASTGIAASHINGTTIHSWSGLGILDHLSDEDLSRLADSDRLIKRYNSVDVLIIDEVSMLHGARLDMVNQLAKALRQSDKPFGGLQIILVGDLFQLPPISRGTREFDFIHLSDAWAELNPKICYLTEQHRQQGNDSLLQILEAMRLGQVDEGHGELLQDRLAVSVPEDLVVTKLYSHNLDVDAINQRHLDEIDERSHTFEMRTKGSRAKLDQLAKSLLAPDALELKVGAEVMFVANNFADGFVNGSRGRVVELDSDGPVVQLHAGRKITVEPHSWSLSEDGKVRAEITQLPLRLAWAITIHKSQGMSLDAAEIDLSRAFTPGMGYVALSRVRSLDGLYLKGVNNTAMAMHPQIYDLDKALRNASSELSGSIEDIGDEVIIAKTEPIVDETLFVKLKDWRYKRATADKLPAFMIAHDTALSAVASTKPVTPQQLLGLAGFGSRKVEAYGTDILQIVAAHSASRAA
ncbi:MAG: AAA family ATPase [Patescibacteria group bacterium]